MARNSSDPEIFNNLKSPANNHNIAEMFRFGINPADTCGISIIVPGQSSNEADKDFKLVSHLWPLEVHQDNISASLIDVPVLRERRLILNPKAIVSTRNKWKLDSPVARWIAIDARLELASPVTRVRLKGQN